MSTFPRHPAFRPLVAVALLSFLGAGASLQAELTLEQRATLPPAASRPVDFARDIQPIFEASCVQCHGRGKAKGSFSLETRADFLEGGDAGSAVVVGNSADSLVVEMISGLTPDNIMPQKGQDA
jgi:mono/diheme cytochrome c family protein